LVLKTESLNRQYKEFRFLPNEGRRPFIRELFSSEEKVIMAW
jgi:hypothetical protein